MERSWSSLKYYPAICLEWLSRIIRYLSQDSLSVSHDMNLIPPNTKGSIHWPSSSVSSPLPYFNFLFLVLHSIDPIGSFHFP
jgi:hypothetical protein